MNSSQYGPYYPWAQPALAMVPGREESYGAFQVGPETLYIVILGSFIVYLTSGWLLRPQSGINQTKAMAIKKPCIIVRA
ncbi:hypothetical protein AB6A23_01100 [Paenibacillus tarimensis]